MSEKVAQGLCRWQGGKAGHQLVGRHVVSYWEFYNFPSGRADLGWKAKFSSMLRRAFSGPPRDNHGLGSAQFWHWALLHYFGTFPHLAPMMPTGHKQQFPSLFILSQKRSFLCVIKYTYQMIVQLQQTTEDPIAFGGTYQNPNKTVFFSFPQLPPTPTSKLSFSFFPPKS